jgi:hypothetical protein
MTIGSGARPGWVTITAYENTVGAPPPLAALRAWLRERGIDWMPFRMEELRFDLPCGAGHDGRWRGWAAVRVEAGALWRLGLHPEQPAAAVDGPSPPEWWHDAGERYALLRHPRG